MMNGADLIAGILKQEGIDILTAFPHSDLIDSCAKAGIRPIIVRQERQALHIADGYARMNAGRKFCCSTVQYGPGSENAAGAIAQCYGDNVPVLHIPGGYPRCDSCVAPNYLASRNLQLTTKWCETAPTVQRIPQMMQNAFSILRNGRPGPVVLEIPVDLFTAEADKSLLEAYRAPRRSSPEASSADIEQLAEMIRDSENPVIIAGQGILYAQACRELQALAETTQIPVMSTLNGKSCFPEDHPLYLGCAGGSRPDCVNHFLDKADLLVGLGTSFTRSDYITPFPTGKNRIAQLTNCEYDIGKDYPVDLGILGDAKSSIDRLNTLLQSGEHRAGNRDNAASEIAMHKRSFLEQWTPLLQSESVPINPYRVVADLMHAVDRNKTVITHDAGSPRDQVTAFWESPVPHGYMGWGKTTQLGTGLGLVQGARLARPDWHAVNIMGDAAIGMVGMDFETGVRNSIGTTTVILKNHVMGGYSKYHPNASRHYRIEVLGGDYTKLAQALGGYGERVTEPGMLTASIHRALEANDRGIPAILEVISSEESRIPRNLPATL